MHSLEDLYKQHWDRLKSIIRSHPKITAVDLTKIMESMQGDLMNLVKETGRARGSDHLILWNDLKAVLKERPDMVGADLLNMAMASVESNLAMKMPENRSSVIVFYSTKPRTKLSSIIATRQQKREAVTGISPDPL